MSYRKLIIALSELCGDMGRRTAVRIAEGKFSKEDYDAICENIEKNKSKSIIKHFGIVHYFYLKMNEQTT